MTKERLRKKEHERLRKSATERQQDTQNIRRRRGRKPGSNRARERNESNRKSITNSQDPIPVTKDFETQGGGLETRAQRLPTGDRRLMVTHLRSRGTPKTAHKPEHFFERQQAHTTENVRRRCFPLTFLLRQQYSAGPPKLLLYLVLHAFLPLFPDVLRLSREAQTAQSCTPQGVWQFHVQTSALVCHARLLEDGPVVIDCALMWLVCFSGRRTSLRPKSPA